MDRRSAATVIANETDGRPATTPVLLSPDLLIRNSRFATDLRNPGDQSISDANARESAGFLGNSAGDTTYDPPFLTNGGVIGASGQERCFTIPTSARTDLQFGRDDVAVSLSLGPWAQVNGATQTLMARRTDGGVENLLVRTDPANGNLIVKVGGVENTVLQATHGLHDTKTHLLTITSKGATGVGQMLVDGVSKATLTVGTTNAHGSTITPLPFMFMARPGTSVVWWAFAQVHWLDIANAYIGALEDQGRLAEVENSIGSTLAAVAVTRPELLIMPRPEIRVRGVLCVEMPMTTCARRNEKRRWSSVDSVVVWAIFDGFPSVSCQRCRRYHPSNKCARESVG